MHRKIDISHKTIFFITAFLLGIWMLFLIRDLLIILFAALIFMSALSPLVKLFDGLKFPKALGIALTYMIILSIIIGILSLVVPTLIRQTSKLIVTLPPLTIQLFNAVKIDPSFFQSELSSLSKNAFPFTLTILDNFLTIIFLLVITFYLLLEREELETRFSALFGTREEKVKKSILEIEEKLGSWLRGQLVLSLLIGSLTYIGIFLIDIFYPNPLTAYALPLALIAGVMEVVPVIGPIISAVPAIAIALTTDTPVLAAVVAAMFFFIQQFENHLIVPQVMKRAVGLNPLVVILTIAIGSRLLGVGGALLAVPLAVVIQIIASVILSSNKEDNIKYP